MNTLRTEKKRVVTCGQCGKEFVSAVYFEKTFWDRVRIRILNLYDRWRSK